MATFVVDRGLAIATNRLLASTSDGAPRQIGWGTGAGTAAATDTSLFTEIDEDGSGSGSRNTGTDTQVTTTTTDDTHQVTGTLTLTTSTQTTITNAGLFDNATIGSGSLYFKGDHGATVLDQNDTITYTFKAQYTN